MPEQCKAIIMILTTGARKSEIISAKNDWLINGSLHLPDSKTGEKTIHLPPDTPSIPTMSSTRLQKAWNKIRKEAGLPWLRIHDLRHNYAAVAISNGYSLAQVGELLGHRSTQTTKRYASLKDDAAKAAAKDISDKILSRLSTDKPKSHC